MHNNPQSAKVHNISRKKRGAYTPEFRASAVRLVLIEKQSRLKVADDLGLNYQTLCAWVTKEEHKNSTVASKNDSVSTEEALKIALKKLRIAEEERDILKKAVAFFATTQS